MRTEPQLKQEYEKILTKRVIDISKKLEGLARHASVHAAGVVIADEELTNFIPLYKPPGTDDIVTQFEGPMVEKAGLLKMDFLGLKTLSVLERSRQLVEQIHGEKIDLKNRPGENEGFCTFRRGKNKRRISVRIGRCAGAADENEARQGSGPHRGKRPVSTRSE